MHARGESFGHTVWAFRPRSVSTPTSTGARATSLELLIAAPSGGTVRLMPSDAAAPSPQRAFWGLAAASLVLVLTGVIGYFVIVFHLGGWLPSVRNNALPNWLLIAVAVGLSILAIRRAPTARAPKVILGVDVVLAGLFAAVLYVVTVVPAATGPTLGAPAPDFALVDQSGKTVRLSDLRGAPVLLVFYRGHW